jgi:L-2-hydroxyglutarate oxidase LhgO
MMSNSPIKCEVLVIGGGAIGLGIAIAVQQSRANSKIIIIEKEEDVCLHASGRNSGVIHAGFYYSSETLKSKFCRVGNLELKKFCHDQGLPLKEIGKVVVAKDAGDVKLLEDLMARAQANGVDIELLDERELSAYEPMAKTHEKFLWSPTTSIADPYRVAQALKDKFLAGGGRILCGEKLVEFRGGLAVFASGNSVSFSVCVNSAGAGALSIANECGVGNEFGLLPVLGGYISTSASNMPLKRMVYAAPHPLSPFLGIHFTPTLDGIVKIGPTAMPVLGREQYSISDGCTSEEAKQSLRALSSYVFGDPINAIKTLTNQISQASLPRMVHAASGLVPKTPNSKVWRRGKAGIRSQLIDFNHKVFVQDFIVRESPGVIHVLNAVSPGWTSALPFGRYITEDFIMAKL